MRRLCAGLVLGVLATLLLLVLSPPAYADCVTPELPTLGCLVPGASSPTPTPSPEPTSPATPPAVTEPVAAPGAVLTPDPPAPSVTPGSAPPVAVLVPNATPSPQLAPTSTPAPRPVVPVTGQPVTTAPVVAPLSGVIAASFALIAIALPGLALLLAFLAGLRPTPAPSGGTVNSRRTRMWTGLGVLAAAAVVGGIGWYRLSGEPLLNRQIPFLASAGIVVVLLSVLGGSLIIAEQLRSDQNRVGELEEAVRALTEALAPMIEQPPRISPPVEVISQPSGRARSRRAGAGST